MLRYHCGECTLGEDGRDAMVTGSNLNSAHFDCHSSAVDDLLLLPHCLALTFAGATLIQSLMALFG